MRSTIERDYASIALIQGLSPEASQWPVGDYSNFPTLTALAGHTVVGYCAYRQSAADEAEVLNLAVDPSYRRQGVAESLLRELLNRTKGAVFLEVAETNGAAIQLYQKMGWEMVAIRPRYYQPGNINAVVMKRSSC